MRQIKQVPKYFNFRFIKEALKNKYIEPRLGRWTINHDDKAFAKVDRSNEDHCGVCDNLRNEYIKNKKEN